MLKDYLTHLLGGQDFSAAQAEQAMGIIMAGQASQAQIGSFLTALRLKGISGSEIAGFAAAMRQHSLRIVCGRQDLLDTCGTGGDGKGTFNISTATAFVAAGAGIAVAKHGNRGISSSCGSADVLTALGVKVDLSPEAVAQAIESIGIGFLYAPVFHQAMKHAARPRQELGFRTVFNLLGPLTNPAGAERQLIGVYEAAVTGKVAEALMNLGIQRAMVVHSFDGLDEISTAAPTQVVEVQNGEMKAYIINPEELGFTLCDQKAYRGGSPMDNAVLLRGVLQGDPGPKRDVVLVNAAAALVVGGKAETLAEGVAIAAKSLDSGAAYAKLIELQQLSDSYREEELALS
jgi:anthranilate phosphoribosyltransferase